MKIVADIHIPYIKGVLEPFAEVVYLPGKEISPGEVKDADALLVRTRTLCGASLLDGSAVKFIGTATIGTDHIDMQYCAANGVAVTSAAGSNARGVLQWMAATLGFLSQRGGWAPAERTLGIVGAGNVGVLVKRYADAWGFRVLCSDPPREEAEGLGEEEGFVPAGKLAAESDIITFHTPLTACGPHPTKNLAGKEFFSLVRPGAVIINSARGGVVDEAELKKNIVGKNCIACLDTWAGEPDIDRELLGMAAIATPHIAGYTIQGKANASSMAVNELARHFGLPLRNWYPDGIERQRIRPVSWEEMTGTIMRYCDIGQQTVMLTQEPGNFEKFREEYPYREEYF